MRGMSFPSSPHVSNQRFLFVVKNCFSLSFSFPALADGHVSDEFVSFLRFLIEDFCFTQVFNVISFFQYGEIHTSCFDIQ